MATINCQTAVVTGTLRENSNFDWVNPTSGVCSVTNVGGWCTASSYSVPAAANGVDGKTQGKTLNVTGSDFSFSCPCLNIPGQPKINIGAK